MEDFFYAGGLRGLLSRLTEMLHLDRTIVTGQHSGRAVIFDGYDDRMRRIDDLALDVDRDSVLILRGAGPPGAPGMPKWGCSRFRPSSWRRG